MAKFYVVIERTVVQYQSMTVEVQPDGNLDLVEGAAFAAEDQAKEEDWRFESKVSTLIRSIREIAPPAPRVILPLDETLEKYRLKPIKLQLRVRLAEMLKRGNLIRAIKYYREQSGEMMGLREAKDAIVALQEEIRNNEGEEDETC